MFYDSEFLAALEDPWRRWARALTWGSGAGAGQGLSPPASVELSPPLGTPAACQEDALTSPPPCA